MKIKISWCCFYSPFLLRAHAKSNHFAITALWYISRTTNRAEDFWPDLFFFCCQLFLCLLKNGTFFFWMIQTHWVKPIRFILFRRLATAWYQHEANTYKSKNCVFPSAKWFNVKIFKFQRLLNISQNVDISTSI